MIEFDQGELTALVEFLRDCPGRLCAAVVPGEVGGRGLTERLRAALDLEVRVGEPELTPDEIGTLALELGRQPDRVLIVPLDGRRRFDSEDDAVAFWRQLNYQRERLASGTLRTCLLLNDEADRRLALVADDLHEWVVFFRFPEARGPGPGRPESGGAREVSTGKELGVRAKESLVVLRDQWRRAREAGLPEAQVVWDFARPLFQALVAAGLTREAGKVWELDLREGEALETLDPDRRIELLRSRIRLAELEGDSGTQMEFAQRCLAEAKELRREEERARFLAVGQGEVGDAFLARGSIEKALQCYQKGLLIIEELAIADPGNRLWQRDVSVSHDRVGDVLLVQGDLSGALESYRASLAIAERLTQQDPSNTEWQRDVSVSHNKVGDVLLEQGDLSGALESYRASLAIGERLSRQDTSNTEWQRDVSVSHTNVGDVLLGQGDLSGALESYRASLAIRERLSRQDPSNTQWQRDLAVSHVKIADTVHARGKNEKALGGYRTALSILERLAEQDPGNALWRLDVSWTRSRIKELQTSSQTDDSDE